MCELGLEGRGGLPVRQIKQQAEKQNSCLAITYSDQPADDPVDTPSLSVDIVILLQAAHYMAGNGLD